MRCSLSPNQARVPKAVLAILCACPPTSFIGAAATRADPPLGGGGPIETSRGGSCISAAQEAEVSLRVAEYEARRGANGLSHPRGNRVPQRSRAPGLLTFFPLAGRLWNDLYIVNYADLDRSSQIHAWDCTDYTYDGHNGIDTDIRSFGEQIIGVPVFAAQDGIVIDTHDGEPDMNTVWNNQPSNLVIIDHGSGRHGWYLHLKRGSVSVDIGQPVWAGQQIGLCASSGVSAGPHLHFEIRDHGSVFEPFAGECREGESGWADQPAIERSGYLHDFGLSYRLISQFGGWPAAWPRSGQIALSDLNIYVWFYGTALPPNSSYRVQFYRPNGTLGWDAGAQAFNNPVEWRWYNWWWTYSVPPMHSPSLTGTWHVRLSVNGQVMIEAPIEVRTARTADFNRPPAPISAELVPSTPIAARVLSCEAHTSLTVDDPDYEIVRYEYVWSVAGQEVRRVTSAAHSDVLARNFVTAYDEVRCTVTPKDAMTSGEAVLATAMIIPDCNANGMDDAVDVGLQTSHDSDRNGIPDECTCDGIAKEGLSAAHALSLLAACLSGPILEAADDCQCLDRDANRTVDLQDFDRWMVANE